MSRNRTIALVATTIAAIAGTAGATDAAAPKHFNAKSKVTLASDNPFHGQVSSQKKACVANRTVKVFHTPAGLYGTTTTDASGNWSIPAGLPHGDFYAQVLKRKLGSHRVCRAGTSQTVPFGLQPQQQSGSQPQG